MIPLSLPPPSVPDRVRNTGSEFSKPDMEAHLYYKPIMQSRARSLILPSLTFLLFKMRTTYVQP